jgi:hypothetical protein
MPHLIILICCFDLETLGLRNITARLRTKESENSLLDYPRLGRFDDATAVYVYRLDLKS